MAFEEYACVRDLEVEGRLQLDDENVAGCLISRPDAACRRGEPPSAEKFAACGRLLNEVKEKLYALVGALT